MSQETPETRRAARRAFIDSFMRTFLTCTIIILLTSGPAVGEWYVLRCFDVRGKPIPLEGSSVNLIDGTVSFAVAKQSLSRSPLLCTTRQPVTNTAFELPCPLERSVVVAEPQWTFFGRAVVEYPATRAVPHRGTLNIANLTESDIGEYRCNVKTARWGEIIETWYLKRRAGRWIFIWKGFHGKMRTFRLTRKARK